MIRFLPFVIVMLLFGFLGVMLMADRNPQEIKSVLIGRPLPLVSFARLGGGEEVLSTDLPGDKPILINFFASWCLPCRAEHDTLLALAARGDLTLVGVAYKDKPADTRRFLTELGDPFDLVLTDLEGKAAFDFGVSGAPETFLVDQAGLIRYRHWGPMVGETLAQRLFPALEAVAE